MRWFLQSLRYIVIFAVALTSPLLAHQLDEQLLDDAPPAKSPPAVILPANITAPLMPLSKLDLGNGLAPRQTPDQPLDTRNPLTQVAGKMELVERRLSTGLNSSIVGMQRDILADLDKLLAPCECQSAGSSKPGNPKQDPKQQDQQQANAKQTPGKKPGDGSKAPSGSGEGNNESQQPSPRQVMEATWGNLPARERERVFEAAGESFLPKYSRSIRQYFERLAEEDVGK